MTIHLYLVRHGQTYFNLYNRLQGWSNSPLTEAGRADAVKAGNKLAKVPLSAAFCSDTTRAQDTAHAILQLNTHSLDANITEPEAHMEFREQFYGYFEGRDMSEAWWAAGAPHGASTYAQILEKFGPQATRDFLKEADPFHHAENNEEYWQRIERGFKIIADSPNVDDESHVLLISHGNTLLSLMQRLTVNTDANSSHSFDLTVRPANGSVTRIDCDADKLGSDFEAALTVVGYNE